MRIILACLAIFVAWTIWVQAQPSVGGLQNTTASQNQSATAEVPSVSPERIMDKAADGVASYLDQAGERLAVGPLQKEVLGNPLWRYLLFLFVLVLALIISKILDFLFTRQFKHWSDRLFGGEGARVAEKVRKPIRYVLLILAIRIGVAAFNLSTEVEYIVSVILDLLFIALVAFVLIRGVDILEAWFIPRIEKTETKLDDQLIPIIRKALKIFIGVLGFIFILERLDQPVTGLVASLGLGGLALALAAQETLANLFGSIAILADRPFHVGERVQAEGHDGPIESIGLRSTRIRTLDGTLVSVPNSKMANTVINNIQKRPTIKRLYTVGVTYDTGFEKMKRALEILRDIHKEAPDVDNYWVYFSGFGASSLDILVICWSQRLAYEEYLKQQEWINLEIIRRFDEADIEIAFPTRTLWMKSDQQGLFGGVQGEEPS